MATLYELVKEIENFDLQIDEETGELLNIDELDALQLERMQRWKTSACGLRI